MSANDSASAPSSYYPLTDIQRGILLQASAVPEDSLYHAQVQMDLSGTIDVRRLVECWESVTARHGSLRTSISADGEYGEVWPRVEVPVTVEDWTQMGEAGREEKMAAALSEDLERVFDLQEPPLWRLLIIRWSASSVRVLWSFHHALLDGASASVVLRDVQREYEGLVAEHNPAQFSNLVTAAGEGLDSREDDEFWDAALSGVEPAEALPFDLREPGGLERLVESGRHGFDAIPILIPDAVAAGMHRLADSMDSGLVGLVRAAWSVVLGVYYDKDDVILGVTESGRVTLEDSEVVGPMVRTLPLRLHLPAELGIANWLAQADAAQSELVKHQGSSLVKVQERSVGAGRELVRTLVTADHAESPTAGWQILASESRVPYALVLVVSGTPKAPRLQLHYDRRACSERIVLRAAGHLERVLTELPQKLDEPLGRLGMLSTDELDELCHWNDTAQDQGDDVRIECLVEQAVAQTPEAPAVFFKDEWWSYRDIEERANRVARYLRSRGLTRGEHVAVLTRRSALMIADLLGILKAGGCYVPLEPATPSARRQVILTALGVRYLLIQSEFLPCLDSLESVDSLSHVVCCDGPGREVSEGLSAESCEAIDGQDPSPIPAVGTAEDSAYVIFTSGSTGIPKGVVVSHRPVINMIRWVNRTFSIGPDDRMLFVTSLTFDLSVYDMFGILAAGGSIRVAAEDEIREPARLVAMLRDEPVTFWDSAPAALMQLIPFLGQEPGEIVSRDMRLVFMSGDWIPVDSPDTLRRAFPALTVVGLGGATEATVWSNYFVVDRVDPRWVSIPYGKPIANARYYVLDASYRQCPVGVPGDLFIAGPCLSVGYAGDPGLTSEKYLPDLLGKPGDRMYRTGDRARWRPDGNLEFLGRLDSQVKIRGYRIELGEIDSVLRDNPMVEDAATVVRTDPGGDRSLLTAVVLRASEVAEEFGAELSSERVERWRVVYDSLPYESEKRDDFAGWTSSFTGRPLPLDDMRAWRDEAVELVRRFNPSHVLEIGCGSGLILMPLAEAGVRCTGLDLSASAVDSVRHRVSESNLGGSVTLRHGDALDLPNLDLEPVDTVLMNSVVQYFPNADYLARALDAALDHVSDGGRLIVGDVRSLPLLEAFHTAVVVARSDNSTTRGEARAAVRRGVEAEEELVLAPAFFRAWAERSKRVVRVEIKPKMSSDANEMALFRYQVVLHVGPQRVPDDQDIPELSFAGRAFDCSEVVAALEQRPAALRITGVPLARLTESLEAVRWLSQEGANASLGEFDPEQGLRGIDPEVLTELVNRSGYQVSFSWEEHGSDGAYDAFLSLSGEAIDPQSFISDVHLHADVPLEQFANQPLSGEVNDHALLEIRNFLEDRLPPYMLPGFISVLDRLPITSSGKLDRKALIEGQPVRTAKDNRPARNMVEQVLVGLWKSTLGLADVGIGDNFFDLGGHSLLAAQLVTRLKGTFGFDLPIRVLLEHPTISEVATELYRINRDRDVPPAQPLVVVHDDAPAPASFEQRRLYFLEQLTPGMKAYTINWIVPLPARTATEDAWRCLRLMAERHEALRTVLRVRDGEVVQIVSTDPWGEPRTEDVTSTDEARVAIREFWDQAFDLDDGPLARAMLLRIADDQDCLAMSAHHTVFDGYSIGLFVTEYIAMLQSPGADKLESGETIRYGDYARWQSCWLDEPHFGAQVDFWRHELQGTPEVLALPTDRPRPKEQSFDGAVIRRELSTELSNRLAEVARGLRVTDYVVILSAFSALLARYSGQDVVVVGVPVASRVRLELEPILGFLVNSLPVGVDLRSTPTFGELLQQVQMRLLNAQAHQEIPLERLIDALGSQRDLSYNPLFQVMCADESLPLLEHVSDKMPVSPWMLDMVEQGMSVGVARFDLTLMARKVGRSWKLDFEYDTALFDAATIAEMADRFGVFIEAALNDPEALVETLPLMSAEDSASSLSVLSTPQVYLQPSLPGSLVESWSTILRRCPDRVAVSWGGGQVSYGVLDVLSDGVAGLLRGCGVGRGSLVGLCVPRSFEAVVVLLGVVKAGAGYVPLDPSYPADRLEFMVSDSGVSVVVASRDSLAVVPEGVSQVLIVEEFWSGLGSAAGGFVDSGAGLDDVAYVMYTSGSTGRPKGVAVTHRGISRLAQWQYENYELSAPQRVLHHTSINFDISVWELTSALLSGSVLVVADPDTRMIGEELTRALVELGIEIVTLTPTALATLPEQSLPQLRCIGVGGEACSLELARTWAPRRVFYNGYGPTEATIVVSIAKYGPDVRRIHIGKAIAGAKLLVLDGGLRVVPVGVAGELFVGGPGLARGYLGRPDLTAERFVADPFAGDGSRLYRTGDRVRVLADGNLEWLGRLDDQVKIRGFRVELGEIESVLGRHPAVRQAVVVVNDQGRSKRLVGFVVLREAVSGEVLRAFAGESLPAYMVPSVVMDVESLPLGPTGKVDRRALAAFPVADSGVEFVSPRSVVEERLAVLWRDVLGLDRPVGVFDGFFALGGDSILSLQLVFRAKQEGLFFSVKDLFRYQTIAELAPEVSCAEAPEVVADQGIVVGGVELSPVQRWFFSRGLVNPDYFNQSVVVDVPTGLGVNVWERLVLRLLEQHDAFRCRFERGSDGWRAEFVEMPSVAPLEVVDVSGVDVAGVAARVAEVGSRVQAGLSLGEAPLFRAVLFAGGGDGSDRLLLVAHHLVVDVVSWRVVLEDLDALLECVSQGREWVLPKKSSSWLQWMSRLVEDAGSAASLAEVGYWRDQVSVSGELPVAAGAGANVMARSGVLDEVLGVEDTRGLLQEVPAVFGTRVNDALLTAVAAAVGAWSGADQVRLDLEGHGREDVFEGVDVSRTVGWFTTISPVALPVPSRGDLGAGLKRVKELLRGRPRQGLGYGLVRESDEVLASAVPAQMSFNYLGQFEAGAGGGFAAGAGLAGPDWDPANERPYLIDIVGRVEDQMLHLEWSYGPSHSREVIARVAKDTMDVLRQLVGLARSGQVQGYSPSDLPLSGLDQDALDEAVAAWRELPAWRLGRSGRPVEDCYPQTPIQQGLWFQSQFAAGEGVYHVQMVFDIDQPVDLEVFREAWVRVMRRHSILRTSFWGAGTDHALQIVWDTDQVPLTVVDWRDDPAGPEDRLAGFLSDDRTRGFEQLDLPQWRVLLARTGEQTYKVVWSAHHAILDGWSIGLVLHDLTRCYAAVLNHEQLDLPAPVSYRDYVAWLTAQPTEPTEQFWRDYLATLTNPTPLPVEEEPAGASAARPSGIGQLSIEFGPEVSHQIAEFAQGQGVTVNTLMQAAWALLLARYTGRDDVVFGTVVSGRTDQVKDVERIVGLFINTLPLYVTIPPNQTVKDWLADLQRVNLQLRQHEHTPLHEIQHWTQVPPGTSLFNTLFDFENYPEQDRASDDLVIQMSGSVELINYPLGIVVSAREQQIRAVVQYQTADFSSGAVERLLDRYVIIARQLVDNDRTLDTIDLLSDAERDLLLGSNFTDSSPDDESVRDMVARLGDAAELDLLEKLLAELESESPEFDESDSSTESDTLK